MISYKVTVYFFSEIYIILLFLRGFSASTINTFGRPKKKVLAHGLDSEKL